jgi:hypothetical protein
MPEGQHWGVFAKVKIKCGTMLGYYTGEILNTTQRKSKYGTTTPDYLFKLGKGKFVDANDPRSATFSRWINSTGKGNTANVEFLHYGNRLLVRANRIIQANEELLCDYGPSYEWKKGERRAAKAQELIREPQTEPSRHHTDLVELPEDSLLAYKDVTTANWELGRVIAVDDEADLVETHRLGSYQRLKNKPIDQCSFLPAYIDPADGKMVFTEKPKSRWIPVYDLVPSLNIICSGFYLTNKNKLHAEEQRVLLG